MLPLNSTFKIEPQPDDASCGPTSLQAVYRHFGMEVSVRQLMDEVTPLKGGGTLGVFLGMNALHRGFRARIYTYNLQVIDPTWFPSTPEALIKKLKARRAYKKNKKKMSRALDAYGEFLKMGGEVLFENIRPKLLRSFLEKGQPILTGLSSTYLYNCSREMEVSPTVTVYDDVRGDPSGHFVVLYGLSIDGRKACVADPFQGNPLVESQYYKVSFPRLISAIMLGILTYDCNLLIISPKEA